MKNLRICKSCATCKSLVIEDDYEGFDLRNHAEYYCGWKHEEREVSRNHVCDNWKLNDAEFVPGSENGD